MPKRNNLRKILHETDVRVKSKKDVRAQRSSANKIINSSKVSPKEIKSYIESNPETTVSSSTEKHTVCEHLPSEQEDEPGSKKKKTGLDIDKIDSTKKETDPEKRDYIDFNYLIIPPDQMAILDAMIEWHQSFEPSPLVTSSTDTPSTGRNYSADVGSRTDKSLDDSQLVGSSNNQLTTWDDDVSQQFNPDNMFSLSSNDVYMVECSGNKLTSCNDEAQEDINSQKALSNLSDNLQMTARHEDQLIKKTIDISEDMYPTNISQNNTCHNRITQVNISAEVMNSEAAVSTTKKNIGSESLFSDVEDMSEQPNAERSSTNNTRLTTLDKIINTDISIPHDMSLIDYLKRCLMPEVESCGSTDVIESISLHVSSEISLQTFCQDIDTDQAVVNSPSTSKSKSNQSASDTHALPSNQKNSHNLQMLNQNNNNVCSCDNSSLIAMVSFISSANHSAFLHVKPD